MQSMRNNLEIRIAVFPYHLQLFPFWHNTLLVTTTNTDPYKIFVGMLTIYEANSL